MGEFNGKPLEGARECPFCHHVGATLGWRYVKSRTYRYDVSCDRCHGSTGGYRTEREAKDAWEGMA